jgi:hypothetical protein
MEGFQVVTSDDCKFGHVVGRENDHLIIEHGTLRKTKHAVPDTFAHVDDSEQVVRLSVPKQIVEDSPKLEDDNSFDEQAIAQHYGLAEGEPASETEGYGDVLPDDPARSADQDAMRAGRETADQQRAQIREGGIQEGQEDLGESPALLGDRIKGSR